MAIEIERRFLVRGDAWRAHQSWQAELRQGYLVSGADGLTLRVRLSRPPEPEPAHAWLTLKALPPGQSNSSNASNTSSPAAAALTRLEFEYPIPLEDAEALLALCGAQLAKRRHGLDLPGGDWVLDVFEGANAPLLLAEVELEAADSPLTIPPWCWREVSGEHSLSNAALARRPLALWSPEQLSSLGL